MRAAATILRELAAVLPQAANDGAVALEQAMVRANRIFTSGAGRSGLMLTAFTNRLMHLGLSAHRVGDVTSPAIRAGDLLIVASRSGSTAGPLANAHIAAASGAAVVAVTADPLSPLAQCASATLVVASSPSVQPMGSLFEQALLLTLDAVVLDLMYELQETDESMRERHATME
ncbi:6-phospho-3-hexuloisomerase [Actinobaculum sp. 352]|uniref:6-phospho-3-hexuloisomerase n=1 Tax=Actinobaculum sp. 352 TaxID=2490946 RepID=UPI000F7E72B7|nr:6-phospho-3-hexuloisomerase [Actinobaculum sp. 352]RTE50093.1 SIS domain-containing protein [Actinobaculum sp. 352]